MSTHVVVIGGSVAGLAAAAALAPAVDDVVVVERGRVRAGTLSPQGMLPHVMCVAGGDALESRFPGFHRSLLDQGAAPGGIDPQRVPVYWHAAGRARRHLVLAPRSHPRALCGRRYIEPELRRRVGAIPNVRTVHGRVHHGTWRNGRLCGVTLADGERLEADLVVDASGRAGPLRQNLCAVDPPVSEVVVSLRYTGFLVERRPEDDELGALVLVQNTASTPRMGALLPLDSQRWQVVLGGYFGEGAASDAEGASAFAGSLADPVLAPFLRRPFLEQPRRYTFRSSILRRWDKVASSMPGLVALGDSVASFNPIYGQGMSSALLQAAALGEEVGRTGMSPGLEQRVATRLASVVADPWSVATGGDLMYPRTVGHRPPGHRWLSRYVERVMRTSASDEVVNAAWTDVQQLLAAPATLLRPRIMRRVLTEGAPSPADESPRSTRTLQEPSTRVR